MHCSSSRRRQRFAAVLAESVEHRDAFHGVGMIDGKPMRDAAAAVVPREPEAREPEVTHHLDHVQRHRALRVGGMARVGRGLRRVAVAAQVRADNGELARQRGGDPVPHRVRLRIAVEQQQRRPAAADHAVNPRARGVDVLRRKAGEQFVRAHSGIPMTINRRGRRISSRRPPTSPPRTSPARGTPRACSGRPRRRAPRASPSRRASPGSSRFPC